MPDSNDYFVFLPWADLLEEIRIGPFTFSRYSELRKANLWPEELSRFFDTYFSSFVDQNLNPVRSVTLCLFDNSPLQKINDEHYEKTRDAVNAILFTQISYQSRVAIKRNQEIFSFAAPADDYELIADTYYSGKNFIAFRAGKILHTGLPIGEVKFMKPWCAGFGVGAPGDKEVLCGLSTLLYSEDLSKIKERIFTALKWFHLAHSEAEHVTPVNKLVMMMTAFEVLLDLPERNKKWQFGDRLENRLVTNKMHRAPWTNPRCNHVENRTNLFLWALNFYKLRCSIVHEGLTRTDAFSYQAPTASGLTQLIVADLVFWQCVVQELYDLKLIGENLRELIKIYEPTPEEMPGLERAIKDMFFSFSEINESLGWQEQTPLDLQSEDDA